MHRVVEMKIASWKKTYQLPLSVTDKMRPGDFGHKYPRTVAAISI